MVSAQQYIDENYPQKLRGSLKRLDLSNQNLEGDLSLDGFLNLKEVNLSSNPQLGKILDEDP